MSPGCDDVIVSGGGGGGGGETGPQPELSAADKSAGRVFGELFAAEGSEI